MPRGPLADVASFCGAFNGVVAPRRARRRRARGCTSAMTRARRLLDQDGRGPHSCSSCRTRRRCLLPSPATSGSRDAWSCSAAVDPCLPIRLRPSSITNRQGLHPWWSGREGATVLLDLQPAVTGWSWSPLAPPASRQRWMSGHSRVYMNLVGSFELVCSTGAIETDLSQ